MKSLPRVFNTILFAALIFGAGCQSSSGFGQKKEFSTLRFHLTTNLDGTDRTTTVQVYRDSPVPLHVNAGPFVDEGNILHAAVVTDPEHGYAIQVRFDRRGTLLLDNFTTANKGRRIAIFSQFDETARWLAAPVIRQRIADGAIVFTPDASIDEAERIVRGLNNVAEKIHGKKRS